LNQVIFVDSSNICLIQVINYLKLIQEKFYYLILAKFFFCVGMHGINIALLNVLISAVLYAIKHKC
jgi:heme/copper-type cytochrome/quinol oxidase subunit 3